MPSGDDIWDGTQPHPLAEFASYKIKQEERPTLEAAYSAQEQSNHFSMPDDIWPDLDVLLSQHCTQRAEWKGDKPKTQIDQALIEFDGRLELAVRDIENLMFNNWLAPQFGPDRNSWAELRFKVGEARARIQSYRGQIKVKRFKRVTKRKLRAETTSILQNILARHRLSLVSLGTTQYEDIRRSRFLAAFFALAEDSVDEKQERTLLTGVAKVIRQQQRDI